MNDLRTAVCPLYDAAPQGRPVKHFTPMKLSVWWLAGTFVAFLLVGQVGEVEDLTRLTIFVVATIAAFMLGYWLSIKSRPRRTPAVAPQADTRTLRRVTLASALYVALYGLSLLVEYGATSPASVLSAITHPGAAYFAKFDVYQRQQTEASNPIIQVLTLVAVLYPPLVPYLILFWKRLTLAIRLIGVLGILLYASFFLFIGTMKGLGDLLIFSVVALMVRQATTGTRLQQIRRRRRTIAIGVLLAFAFLGYMSFNQSQRISGLSTETKFQPNPIVMSLTGDQSLARGVSVVAFYPTHGYLGLSKNLGTPFEWADMRGGSPAFDSYLAEYGFGESVKDKTYPARTEVRTGWPAGMFWATAYPWLASDLTFPGVVLFMGFVGWCLARFWVEAVAGRSQLALLLLGQVMLFVVFIPANNQIGASRPTLIGFTTLVLLYVLNRATGRMITRTGRAPSAAR